MFSCVLLWLEERSPDLAAFLHALEWAWSLRVPLRAVGMPNGSMNGEMHRLTMPLRNENSGLPVRLPELNGNLSTETLAEICRLNDIEWSIIPENDLDSDSGLAVLSAALPAATRGQLLRRAVESQKAALLCASEWKPLRRPLLLHEVNGQGRAFLQTASTICGQFRVRPVVLTIAATESEASRGQQFALSTMLEQGQLAQFDYAVHWDTSAIVELEANCRRCTHLIASSASGLRRRWGRAKLAASFLDLSRSLSVLVLR